jgi:hypothetical protein
VKQESHSDSVAAEKILEEKLDSVAVTEMQKRLNSMSSGVSEIAAKTSELLTSGRGGDAVTIPTQAEDTVRLRKRQNRLLNPTV